MTIKWNFGEVRIQLFKSQFEEWRTRISQGFEEVDVGMVTSKKTSMQTTLYRNRNKAYSAPSLTTIWESINLILND